MNEVINLINSIAWVGSNVLVAYIAFIVVVFVILYRLLFNIKATTAGKLIFRFMISLVGVIGLVFVGTFIDPSANREWWNYPGDVAGWRPIIRFLIYGYVAVAVTSLTRLLVIRRWFPHRLKTADDLKLMQPKNTGSIPTVK